MNIDVTFLHHCIGTLERAAEHIIAHGEDDSLYDIMRAACVKEFELILEQSSKLLRKRLADYAAGNKEIDRLNFKDVFRRAAKHDLIDTEAVERWFVYRDNRNNTAHDHGKNFAEATMKSLPQFLADAKALTDVIEGRDNSNPPCS